MTLSTGPDVTGNADDAQDTAEKNVAGVTSLDLIDGAAQHLAGFDPDKHEKDPETGLPLYTPTGRFRKKPRRLVNKEAAPEEVIPGEAPQEPVKPQSPARKRQVRVTSDQTASMLLNFTVGGMAAVVGPEWDFQSPEEAQSLKAAVSAYIEAKGNGQMSPEMMLILAIGAYSLPRIIVPNTQQKFAFVFGRAWNATKKAVMFWKK